MKGGRMTKEEVRRALSVIRMASDSIQEYADTIDIDKDIDNYEEYQEYADRIRNSMDEIKDVIRNVNRQALRN